MTYRKLAADQLFTGREMLTGGQVLIFDQSATIVDIVNAEDAGGDVEQLNGIISPGFINCHCHLELSHLKNIIPEGTGMVDFLLAVMRNRNFSGDIIGQAIEEAENEMIANGIVAVADICNTADTIAQKKKQNLYYHNFIEATGFVEATAEQRFESAKELFRQFSCIGASSIVPHAPYSVSRKLFQLIDEFDKNALLTMHNQESRAENEFYFNGEGDFQRLFNSLSINTGFKGTGKTSFASVIGSLSDTHRVILVHNVTTTENDIQQAAGRPELYWCFCPNANRYINSMLPDIRLFAGSPGKLVLGTDSLASNHRLSIWEEIAAIRDNFSVPLEEIMGWATINGAHALGIENRYGSFEKGKKPGIINIVNDAVRLLA